MPKPFRAVLSLLVLATPLTAGAAVAPSAPSAPSRPRLAACFAPGTPEEYMAAVAEAAARSSAALSLAAPVDSFEYTAGDRWSRTASQPGPLAQGDPTTLTWSVVPDGTLIDGFVGEPNGASDLHAFLSGIYGSEAAWLPVVQAVFDRWSELTGVVYVHEPADDGAAIAMSGALSGARGVRGDLRISGHAIDGTNGILAYNFFPNHGDMVIDTADGNFGDLRSGSLLLRNTLAHEHGHGLGFDHSCPLAGTKLMEPYLALSFDGPQLDDVLAGNRAYGDVDEPDDTPAAASALGALGAGGSATRTWRSIDDEGDRDVYSFTVADGARVSVTLQPVGSTYAAGPQETIPPYGCTAGSPFDALRQQDLAVDLLDRDGTTVLASADALGAGGGETLTDVALGGGAGTYFVRVTGKTLDRVQLYDLAVSIGGSAGPNPTVYEATSPSGIVDPLHAVGTAAASPFALAAPGPSSPLFYQVDDGFANPPRIRLVKDGAGLDIYFP